jgi:hypothetical protein
MTIRKALRYMKWQISGVPAWIIGLDEESTMNELP